MKAEMFTTLALLRKYKACESGLKTLIDSLPKNTSEKKEISLIHILESNCLDHFFWAFRATTKAEKKVKRLILHDIVKEVQYIYERRFPENDSFKQVLKALSTGRGLQKVAQAARADCQEAYDVYDKSVKALDLAGRAAPRAIFTAIYAAFACASIPAFDITDVPHMVATVYASAHTTSAVYATYAALVTAKQKQTEIVKKYLK